EAKRKLKLTDADLTRLDDILDELGKNVRSLRYQVGKTKRYKTLSERIREWGLILLRKNLSRLLKDKLSAEASLTESLQASRTGDDTLGERQRTVEEEKLKLVEFEQRNNDLQNRRYEIRKLIQASEEKLIQSRERKGEAERKIERAIREIDDAKIRLEKIRSRVSGVMVEEEVTSEKIGIENEAVKSLGGKFEEISFRIERIQSELIDLKQTQLDFLQDQVRVKSSQEHFESVLGDLDERSRQLRERIVELETEIAGLAGLRSEREGIVDACRQKLDSFERSRSEALNRVDELDLSLSGRESSLNEARTELARIRSRHELFNRMKENFEGFPGGARYILKNRNDHVRGPLAEVLKIDDAYRPALESVLGGMTDGVVVDSMSGAMNIIEELTAKKLGGVRLFVEDSGNGEDEASPGGFEGMIGRLSSLIEVEGAKRAMVDRLLGRT
ncbi:MAG TPA: hypothetical protein VLA34_09155, partial [Candidatus Krumholzibacterium sp.]|nr:hypothetical protein [Candidatus Krumholzibacterium sp.]